MLDLVEEKKMHEIRKTFMKPEWYDHATDSRKMKFVIEIDATITKGIGGEVYHGKIFPTGCGTGCVLDRGNIEDVKDAIEEDVIMFLEEVLEYMYDRKKDRDG